MSKFNDILKRHGIIVEQPVASDVPIGAPAPAGTEASALPATTEPTGEVPANEEPSISNQPIPQSEIKKLDPASFIWMVKIIRNAFLAHPDEGDEKKVLDLKDEKGEKIEDINAENAQKVLDSIWPIVSKYMPSELKTYDLNDQTVKELLQKSA